MKIFMYPYHSGYKILSFFLFASRLRTLKLSYDKHKTMIFGFSTFDNFITIVFDNLYIKTQ